jgi:hypothetical protein
MLVKAESDSFDLTDEMDIESNEKNNNVNFLFISSEHKMAAFKFKELFEGRCSSHKNKRNITLPDNIQ